MTTGKRHIINADNGGYAVFRTRRWVKETTNLTDRKGREKCLTKYYVHA